MQVGKVTGREIRKNKDGVADVMLLQVEISDPEDVQTVQLLTQAGEDSNPPDGSLVAILAVGEAWKLGVAVNDGIVPAMAKGEKKIYSSAGGVIKAFINWLAGGNLELNGSADFAVRYSALETAFNQLKFAFNIHLHPGVTTGVGSSGATAQQSTADITGAKVDTVKLP